MAGTGDRPQFRQDLLAESIDEGGAQFIDVMDDATGTAFRFYEVEYALACAMDGERDVGAIIDWADRELGLRPREREVQLLASTLGALGFLSRAAVVAEPSVHTRATAPVMAAVTVDDELAPGVVHATAPASTLVVEEVELGQVARAKAASTPPLSGGDDVELGAPGATSRPVRDKIVVEDVPLGASGPSRERSEVSIKLTDHLALDVADVKEAVRQSQVMKAVDIEAAEAAETAKAAAKEAAPVTPVAVTPAVKVEPPTPIEAAKDAARELATPTEAPPTVTRPRVRKELILVAAIVAIAAGIVVVLKQRQDKEPRPTAGEVDKAANDKAAADRAAMERAAADKAAADKAAAEQAAAAKNVAAEATADPAAADKAAAEKAAADKAAAAQAATDKATADKAAADQKAAAEKAAAEKAAAEQATAAAEKAAAEKAAAEKAAAEKATAAAEKAAAEKAAAEKAAADKAAAEKAAADKAPDDAAKQEAARKARAKARAAAEAREKAELEKLLEKQRKALEERKKAEGQPPAP